MNQSGERSCFRGREEKPIGLNIFRQSLKNSRPSRAHARDSITGRERYDPAARERANVIFSPSYFDLLPPPPRLRKHGDRAACGLRGGAFYKIYKVRRERRTKRSRQLFSLSLRMCTAARRESERAEGDRKEGTREEGGEKGSKKGRRGMWRSERSMKI